MSEPDKLDEAKLAAIEEFAFADKEVIKLYSERPSKRIEEILSACTDKTINNLFIYKSFDNLSRQLNTKDFFVVDTIRDLGVAFTNRLIFLSDLPSL